MQKPANKKLLFCLLPGIITAGILVFLLILYEYAPFGDLTLAITDAHFQYLDFFMYLKNVLDGSDRISYTFGQTLGGCNIAVFSYYLASPFNLLAVFFSKENLHAFFHLLIVCKLSLAAVTFRLFLSERFGQGLQEGFAVLLPVGYALGQYSIAQCSNIMWLDGVYMLPLILLGVYRIVDGKPGRMLVLPVGASLLFNWYTGAVNCLFSGVWFCTESGILLFLKKQRTLSAAGKWKAFCILAVRYFAAMAAGVLLGMVLFLPTMVSLQSGRGGADWEELTWGITGEVPGMLQAYIMGGRSSFGNVSLFCGSLAAVACTGCFFAASISKKEKMAAAGLLLGVTALFYWKPCFFVFSLFKRAESYYYRYSYVGIFVLLFLAAFFFVRCRGRELSCVMGKAAGLFSAALVLLHYLHPVQETGPTYLTAVSALAAAALVALYAFCRTGSRVKNAVLLLAALAVCMEMAVHTAFMMKACHAQDVSGYRAYVENGQRQIDEILEMDDGVYRISQTQTRVMFDDHLTANYNEALAYGYLSISGYTSDPDDRQREFLDRLGYRMNGANMCITNTSVLAADSLLGVKYLLSPYPVSGLELVQELPERNGKYVYKNPFCLPFAFRYGGPGSAGEKQDTSACWYGSSGSAGEEQADPFAYQNGLYAELTGNDERQLYVPAAWREVPVSETEVVYELELPEGNYAVYGNLTWSHDMDAVLKVNGAYETGYAKWLSPSVFYIPAEAMGTKANVQLTAAQPLCVEDVQFYVLDLERMAEAAQEISGAAAEKIQAGKGHAEFVVGDAAQGEYLYISIPYDDGWKIRVNGEQTNAGQFAGCMVTVPLQDGKNVVEMEYHIPYLWPGLLMTLSGIVLAAAAGRVERKYMRLDL